MNKNYLALMAAIAVGFAACKKDKDEEPEPTPTPTPHATIRLAFHFVHGDDAYTLDTLLVDGNGHVVKFDKVRFFASGLHLHDDADVIIADYDGVYLLVDASNASNDWELGTVDAPHIHAVAYELGVDSATNHTDQATFTDPPLNDATMHTGSSTTGFLFAVLEGWVDANADDVIDGTDTPVSYHLYTDDLLAEDEVHAHTDVVNGTTMTLEARVDMAVVAGAVDFLAHPTNNTVDDLVLATQMRDSLLSAIDEFE